MPNYHPYTRMRMLNSPIPPPTPPCSTVTAQGSASRVFPIFAKPFDKFQPQGGGKDGDIFRRFKIRRDEELDFCVHWVRHRISTGIFSRDQDGTLAFRVSSSDLSDLTELGIGKPDLGRDSGVGWTHVYDEDGVSWLTQFRCIDLEEQFPNVFDAEGASIDWNGRVGRYGPSGLTPGDFATRMLSDKNDY